MTRIQEIKNSLIYSNLCMIGYRSIIENFLQRGLVSVFNVEDGNAILRVYDEDKIVCSVQIPVNDEDNPLTVRDVCFCLLLDLNM